MSEPGLDFDLGEMADTIRDTTQRFARDKIAPIAAEIDEKDEFPKHLWPQMGELGLHGITVEEEWGGLGLGYLGCVCAGGVREPLPRSPVLGEHIQFVAQPRSPWAKTTNAK